MSTYIDWSKALMPPNVGANVLVEIDRICKR